MKPKTQQKLEQHESVIINQFAEAYTEYQQKMDTLKPLKAKRDALKLQVIEIALAKGVNLPLTEKQSDHCRGSTTRSAVELMRFNIDAHWVKDSVRNITKPVFLR